jgi:hypothetical protein
METEPVLLAYQSACNRHRLPGVSRRCGSKVLVNCYLVVLCPVSALRNVLRRARTG